MATATKVLLRRGIYQPPQGELRVTGRRLRRYVDQFAKMRALGIKLPVCWGHQPKANPADEDQRASQQFYLGAMNAGYLDDLQIDADGHLAGTPNCPGCEVDPATGNYVAWVKLPDGRQVKSAIGEVSVAIGDWTDGQGRRWKDVIKHVALTPLPVMTGQDGFKSTLSTDSTDENGRTYYLSLASPRRELSCAEEAMFGEDDEDKKKAEEEEAEETPAPVAETPPPPPPPETPPAPAAAAASAAEIAGTLTALAAANIHLPGDTTFANLAERLRVALHGRVLGKGPAGEDDEDEDEDDKGKDGVEYSGDQTTEEERPVMMSLATATTPGEKKLIAREQERHKQRQLKLVDKLVTKGMPVHRANEFREKLTGYTLSLTEDGEVVPAQVDFELATWSEALQHSTFGADVLGKAKKQRRPDPAPESEAKRIKAQEDAGDELAELAGVPARRK